MATTKKKKKIIGDHAVHETDTGSTEVQIALLSGRIDELTTHLKSHTKDFHSRRGLLKIVGKRRRLLQYLKDRNEKSYNALIKKLQLKK